MEYKCSHCNDCFFTEWECRSHEQKCPTMEVGTHITLKYASGKCEFRVSTSRHYKDNTNWNKLRSETYQRPEEWYILIHGAKTQDINEAKLKLLAKARAFFQKRMDAIQFAEDEIKADSAHNN